MQGDVVVHVHYIIGKGVVVRLGLFPCVPGGCVAPRPARGPPQPLQCNCVVAALQRACSCAHALARVAARAKPLGLQSGGLGKLGAGKGIARLGTGSLGLGEALRGTLHITDLGSSHCGEGRGK